MSETSVATPAHADWGSGDIRSIAAEVIEEDAEEEELQAAPPARRPPAPRSTSGVSDSKRRTAGSQKDEIQVPRRSSRLAAKKRHVDQAKWIGADAKNGFVRVYQANSDRSVPVACTVETSAVSICQQLRLPTHCLHLQLAGSKLRRLDPFECPLAIQNAYLANIGFSELRRVQKIGPSIEMRHLLQFVAGRPSAARAFARHRIEGVLMLKQMGGMLHKWCRRLCECSAAALTVYKGTDKSTIKTVIFLAQGTVHAATEVKGHKFCLQVRGIGPKGDRSVLMSFKDQLIMEKWRLHIEQVTSQKDQIADLSGSQLEIIPESLFCLTELRTLNLKQNCLRLRNRSEPATVRAKIGFLDDLYRLNHLTILNLAENSLSSLPSSLCQLKSLVELNVSCNQLAALPTQISGLTRLEVLHAHNNHLSSLPDSMSALTRLSMIVLAFNHFLELPPVLAELKGNEDIIISGNRISCIADQLADRLRPIRRINLRMNQLSLNGSSSLKLDRFEQLAYLDVRDNLIESLDLQCLLCLEFVCCSRNRLVSLKLNGSALKTLLLSENKLTSLDIEPAPSQLEFADISRNRLSHLPAFIGDSQQLSQLHISHNFISELPTGLLNGSSCCKLRLLRANHNAIRLLPEPLSNSPIEELLLHSNRIAQLPASLFSQLPRLKQLNLTGNRLTALPPAGDTAVNSKLQELCLSFNQLDDAVLRVVAKFSRLRVLRLSFNQLTCLMDETISGLRFLSELNISGNQLRSLPQALQQLDQLWTLKAHSNMLQELPDFRNMPELRALDLGCNNLLTGSVRDLMEAKVSFLDLSCNDRMGMSMQDLSAVKNKGTIHTVNSAGTDLLLQAKGTARSSGPFQFGLAESPGSRNKICVSVLKKMPYPTPDSGVFAMFDGGRNAEVPRQLQHNFCRALKEQLRHGSSSQQSVKYALLTCHRQLGSLGQRLGASGAALYLKRKAGAWEIVSVNAGDVEVVLAQQDKAFRLTRLFTAQRDRDEAERVFQCDGVVTEDGRVNGSCDCTRQLGCAFQYPHVIPDPQVTQVNLTDADDAIIIANKHFWNFVSYDEAAVEVKALEHPVAAAKRLLDLAQAYGSTENISILVVKVRLGRPDQRRPPPQHLPPQQQQQLPELDSDDEYAVLNGSILSLESDTSEDWMRRRIEGYQRLKGNRTVEEIEAELHPDDVIAGRGRMFAKKHEKPQQLEAEMRRRLAGEVKQHELDYELAEVLSSPDSDSDSLGRHGNWTHQRGGGSGGQGSDRVTQMLANANRSLTRSDAFGPEPDRLSEITNSELLLAQPRPDRIADAGVDPDSEQESLSGADYDFLSNGAGYRAPDAGHERMREETYMMDSRTAKNGRQSAEPDTMYAKVQKSTPPRKSGPAPPVPHPLAAANGGGKSTFIDTGTEPESPTAADPLTPSSTFSFPASRHALQPQPNISLSQQAPMMASRGFEDQELVADIASAVTSTSTLRVAERDEDTHL